MNTSFLALAILPKHGILGRTLDGQNTVYVDRYGNTELLPKNQVESALSKSYYLHLKLARVVTPEQAVHILNTESDEYAKLYE